MTHASTGRQGPLFRFRASYLLSFVTDERSGRGSPAPGLLLPVRHRRRRRLFGRRGFDAEPDAHEPLERVGIEVAVLRERAALAVRRRLDARDVDAARDERVLHGLHARVGERLVEVVAAARIGVSVELYAELRIRREHRGQLAETLCEIVRQRALARAEQDVELEAVPELRARARRSARRGPPREPRATARDRARRPACGRAPPASSRARDACDRGSRREVALRLDAGQGAAVVNLVADPCAEPRADDGAEGAARERADDDARADADPRFPRRLVRVGGRGREREADAADEERSLHSLNSCGAWVAKPHWLLRGAFQRAGGAAAVAHCGRSGDQSWRNVARCRTADAGRGYRYAP